MKIKDIVKNNPFAVSAVCVCLIMSVVSFFFSRPLGIVWLFLTVIIAACGIVFLSKALERKKAYLRMFDGAILDNPSADAPAGAFPLPTVFFHANGEITWYNRLFGNILYSFKNNSDPGLFSLFPELSGFSDENADFPAVETQINGGRYTAYFSKLGKDVYAMYLVDDTQLKTIRDEYLATRPVCMALSLDALEQAEDSLNHTRYYSVVTDLERIVTGFLSENNCVFRKYSDGRFIAVTEKVNFEKIAQSRFSVLDKVRQYRLDGQSAEVTLSIGAGTGDSLCACEEAAREALDMAKGRGGDQAAVANGEGDYDFYGGIENRNEKRGKVKSRLASTAIEGLIKNSSAVFISGHTFSDFDSVGAAVGMAAICSALGVRPYIIVNRKTSLASRLIDYSEASSGNAGLFISPEQSLQLASSGALLIIVDTMRPVIVEASGLAKTGMPTVVIDHHRMSVDKLEGIRYLFHEPLASSASEMVAELIQCSPTKLRLSPAEATALLTGIVLDTKNFSMRANVRTFEAAAFLRNMNADTVAVRKMFASTPDENSIIGSLVAKAELTGEYAIAVLPDGIRDKRLICSKTADRLLDTEGVKSSYALYDNNGTACISARSLGEVNVQLVMEALGGGGHQSMAAAQLADTTTADAVVRLKKVIEDYYQVNTKTHGG